MKNIDIDQPTPADRTLMRQTLWKLTAAQKILCVVLIAIVAFAWLNIAERIIAFGRTVDYSGLTVLGAQSMAILQRYNPFFWWALIAICTLIIAYFLKVFVVHTHRRTMARLVSESVSGTLARQLTPAARSVMAWAWQNRRDPISVGVIDRAAREMRANRAAKITLIQQQEAWFCQSSDTPIPDTKALAGASAAHQANSSPGTNQGGHLPARGVAYRSSEPREPTLSQNHQPNTGQR